MAAACAKRESERVSEVTRDAVRGVGEEGARKRVWMAPTQRGRSQVVRRGRTNVQARQEVDGRAGAIGWSSGPVASSVVVDLNSPMTMPRRRLLACSSTRDRSCDSRTARCVCTYGAAREGAAKRDVAAVHCSVVLHCGEAGAAAWCRAGHSVG
jgi:hypothetical protein